MFIFSIKFGRFKLHFRLSVDVCNDNYLRQTHRNTAKCTSAPWKHPRTELLTTNREMNIAAIVESRETKMWFCSTREIAYILSPKMLVWTLSLRCADYWTCSRIPRHSTTAYQACIWISSFNNHTSSRQWLYLQGADHIETNVSANASIALYYDSFRLWGLKGTPNYCSNPQGIWTISLKTETSFPVRMPLKASSEITKMECDVPELWLSKLYPAKMKNSAANLLFNA